MSDLVYLDDADYARLEVAERDLAFERHFEAAKALTVPLSHPANLGQLDDEPFVTDRGGIKGFRILAGVLVASAALMVVGLWNVAVRFLG